MEKNLLYSVSRHRAIISPTGKRDLTTGIEFPAWSEYGTDFASSLGENLFGAESVSLGAVRQIESRLYRYFSCRSDRDFYDAFASAILKQTSSKLDEWLEHAKLFLSRISPKISLGTDPMTDFPYRLK